MSDFEVQIIPYGKSFPYVSPTGKETTLYTIGTLAEALGRTSQAVRKWEIAGIIPPTPFKMKGQRLYSKEHIEALVAVAEKAKIKNGVSLRHTNFTPWSFKEFDRLYKYFFEEGDDKNATKESY